MRKHMHPRPSTTSPSRRARGAIVLSMLVALLSPGLVGEVAEARTSTRVTLAPSGLQYRLIVTISSSRPFTARNRPRSVAIRYGRTSYRLRRAARLSGARAAAVANSIWQTPTRSAFGRLVGKRVKVTVRTAAGTVTLRRTVARQRRPFQPPPSDVRGEEAFRRIKQYFVNSRFTDCPEGWPGCPSEHRYDHCAGGGLDGNWRNDVFPPTTPSMSGRYHVMDAFQRTDGSWGVTYQVALDSGSSAIYTWLVYPDGVARGGYVVGQEVGSLQAYHWQQPAGC